MYRNGSNEISGQDILILLKNQSVYEINYNWVKHSSTGLQSSDLALDLSFPLLNLNYLGINLELSVCSWVEGSDKGCNMMVCQFGGPANIRDISIQVEPQNGTALFTEFAISCTYNASLNWKYSIGYIANDTYLSEINLRKCVWIENRSKR